MAGLTRRFIPSSADGLACVRLPLQYLSVRPIAAKFQAVAFCLSIDSSGCMRARLQVPATWLSVILLE